MTELALEQEPSSAAIPTPSPRAALLSGKCELSRPETNFIRIPRPESFPLVQWGRDFEVRLPLEAKTGFATRRLESALPPRFRGNRKWWGTYFENLSRAFCEAFQANGCLVRFSQTSTDLCRLFHSDNVQVRLIQTLQGPGTEYLLNDNVDRRGLGQGCNERVVIDSARIQRAKEKEILLMRGERWFPGRALVHRSPPIEESGVKRLYLCLDAIWDCD